MDLLQLFASYGGWSWIVAGLVLLGLELVLPGGILLWLGIAGLVTGLAALVQPLSIPMQLMLFGILSLVSVFAWLRYTKGREQASDRPLLNRRAEQMVGQVAELTEPIRDGFGRLPLGDTVWRCSGPDLAAGQRVRIVGADGAVLKVVPA